MASENLQSVIVDKSVAKDRKTAKRIASEFANRIYTSRETSDSFRFRQRPPEDFKKGSFRTKKIPEAGVSLVYGKLRKKNPSKPIRLKNPRTMPDPGPCANLGTLVEWKWEKGKKQKLWEEDDKDWLFLWSPKYKAIVAIPDPEEKIKLSRVMRDGGAARLFEIFASRAARETHEISISGHRLQKLGKAKHIVYRSDKWSGKKEDYIHDFKNGVNIYCGPSLKNPKVFLCFGGKLTCTERGLVN